MPDLDEIERRLVAYIAASKAARAVLSELHGIELTGRDIQDALAETFNVPGDSHSGVPDLELTASGIVDALRAFNFLIYRPQVLAEFTAEAVVGEPLLPSSYLDEQTVKVKGEVWRVHQNDADPFPSTPHAHNYQTGVVLDLGSGEMYDRNRRSIGGIGCKKLLRIRNELTGFTLPSTGCT